MKRYQNHFRHVTLIEPRGRGTISRFTLIELLVAQPAIATMFAQRTRATARAASIRFTLIELLVVIAEIPIGRDSGIGITYRQAAAAPV